MVARLRVLDRADAADRLNYVRNELGLAKTEERFPRKDTCLAIYSHTVNARCPLSETLESAFPWCWEWESELKGLFRAYVEAKQREKVLDYDDLLLYWADMMEEPALARLGSSATASITSWSTIHSAKGQEWDAVFVLNVIDGCIPSDMAVGSREQTEEERRLLYVAMTRARENLHLVQPMRLSAAISTGMATGTYHARSRFIPDSMLHVFERRVYGRAAEPLTTAAVPPVRVDVAGRMRQM